MNKHSFPPYRTLSLLPELPVHNRSQCFLQCSILLRIAEQCAKDLPAFSEGIHSGLVICLGEYTVLEDLLTVMQAVTNETLADVEVKFASDKSACCVIMASAGYPQSYEKGYEITIPADVADSVYVAGAALKDGKLTNNGGRVLGVTSVADTLQDAIAASYAKVDTIHFDNAFCRRDIGQRALKAMKD